MTNIFKDKQGSSVIKIKVNNEDYSITFENNKKGDINITRIPQIVDSSGSTLESICE